jgi:Zn-dependent M28 family amino/carboxypeptidase
MIAASPVLIGLLALAGQAPADVVSASPRPVSAAEARLLGDVAFLADDRREGRGLGTEGIDTAAEYIALVFREIGLKTAPDLDGYYQAFPVRGETRVAAPTALTITTPAGTESFETGVNFVPLAVGAAGKGEGVPVVFAGYGITAKDDAEKLDYDDYAGLDVKDKVVLILRREPAPAPGTESAFAGPEPTSYATFTAKVANATARGAKAVLMVNDVGSTSHGDLMLDFNATPRGGTIPFAMIPRAAADRMLRAAGAPGLDALEEKINATLTPQSRELPGVTASYEVALERVTYTARNVVGVLEGAGPLADETIVVGAHYDHLGRGGPGSMAAGSNEIHNGADDNASGTATVLELARRLAARGEPLPRRIIFVLFSAEERGLLGSDFFVNSPIVPLDRMVAMLNLDMVGRYEENKGLVVYGAATSPGWEPMVEALARSRGLNPKFAKGTNDGFSDSDHSSFYKKDIPVLFFFTGTHPQYHRPADDTALINAEGMSRIADLCELILLDWARRPSRPEFTRLPAAPARDPAAMRGNGAYFGSRPAYGENVEGVKLEGVSAGSPAEKAGLKGGDVIVKFGGLPVKDVESYMVALGARKPGDEVEVVVQRDGQEMTMKVTLGSRPTSRGAQN